MLWSILFLTAFTCKRSQPGMTGPLSLLNFDSSDATLVNIKQPPAIACHLKSENCV